MCTYNLVLVRTSLVSRRSTMKQFHECIFTLSRYFYTIKLTSKSPLVTWMHYLLLQAAPSFRALRSMWAISVTTKDRVAISSHGKHVLNYVPIVLRVSLGLGVHLNMPMLEWGKNAISKTLIGIGRTTGGQGRQILYRERRNVKVLTIFYGLQSSWLWIEIKVNSVIKVGSLDRGLLLKLDLGYW